VRSGGNLLKNVVNVIEEGVTIGANTKVWWFSRIGGRSVIGRDSMIASLCEIGEDCRIGDRVRIQCGCFVSSGTIIEDDVFLGPHATLLNDKYPMQRTRLKGPVLRKGAVIGGGVTILGELEIGENAVVGAHSLVTKNIPRDEVWAGGGGPLRKIMSRAEYEKRKRDWTNFIDRKSI